MDSDKPWTEFEATARAFFETALKQIQVRYEKRQATHVPDIEVHLDQHHGVTVHLGLNARASSSAPPPPPPSAGIKRLREQPSFASTIAARSASPAPAPAPVVAPLVPGLRRRAGAEQPQLLPKPSPPLPFRKLSAKEPEPRICLASAAPAAGAGRCSEVGGTLFGLCDTHAALIPFASPFLTVARYQLVSAVHQQADFPLYSASVSTHLGLALWKGVVPWSEPLYFVARDVSILARNAFLDGLLSVGFAHSLMSSASSEDTFILHHQVEPEAGWGGTRPEVVVTFTEEEHAQMQDAYVPEPRFPRFRMSHTYDPLRLAGSRVFHSSHVTWGVEWDEVKRVIRPYPWQPSSALVVSSTTTPLCPLTSDQGLATLQALARAESDPFSKTYEAWHYRRSLQRKDAASQEAYFASFDGFKRLLPALPALLPGTVSFAYAAGQSDSIVLTSSMAGIVMSFAVLRVFTLLRATPSNSDVGGVDGFVRRLATTSPVFPIRIFYVDVLASRSGCKGEGNALLGAVERIAASTLHANMQCFLGLQAMSDDLVPVYEGMGFTVLKASRYVYKSVARVLPWIPIAFPEVEPGNTGDCPKARLEYISHAADAERLWTSRVNKDFYRREEEDGLAERLAEGIGELCGGVMRTLLNLQTLFPDAIMELTPAFQELQMRRRYELEMRKLPKLKVPWADIRTKALAAHETALRPVLQV